VALGLLAIFHLFPSGLRASYDATAETRVSQFADEALNALRVKGAGETNMTTWEGVFEEDEDLAVRPDLDDIELDGDEHTLQYPYDSSGEYIRYRLWASTAGVLASVRLDAVYGQVGGFTNTFYTEFYFYGM